MAQVALREGDLSSDVPEKVALIRGPSKGVGPPELHHEVLVDYLDLGGMDNPDGAVPFP